MVISPRFRRGNRGSEKLAAVCSLMPKRVPFETGHRDVPVRFERDASWG